MRYVIEDNEIKKKEIARRQATAEQLVDGIDPVNDIHDRRILFELTGRRVEEEDYHNDTSFEEDIFSDGHDRDIDHNEEAEGGLLVDDENNPRRFNHHH